MPANTGEPEELTSTVKALKTFRDGYDGSHWGLTDWYPRNERALASAWTSYKKH